MRTTRLLAIIGFSLALPSTSVAGDGRIEINQAIVDAGGGFPFTISSPGSYVLTGELTVPTNTDALVVTTPYVNLDLNGFSIVGPKTCVTDNCSVGTGRAVSGGASAIERTTVRNGTIRGFGHNCISIGELSVVSDLLVTACGRIGIAVGSGSVVIRNRVAWTGREGIAMSGTAHPAVFAHNTVTKTNLNPWNGRAILGGRPSAGNSCDDGSCTTDGRRRYYLTTFSLEGDHGADDCEGAFHMAAMFELLDLSNLEYDTTRGITYADSGSGPPTVEGWIRTGRNFFTSVACADGSNPWTSSDMGVMGTTASPLAVEGDGSPRWMTQLRFCDTPRPIWCVED